MNEMFATLLTIILFQTSVEAADKIRISMTGFAGQFMTFPLAQKRGFLQEEGFDAEIIRISAAAGRAALTNGDVDDSTHRRDRNWWRFERRSDSSCCLFCSGACAWAGGAAGI